MKKQTLDFALILHCRMICLPRSEDGAGPCPMRTLMHIRVCIWMLCWLMCLFSCTRGRKGTADSLGFQRSPKFIRRCLKKMEHIRQNIWQDTLYEYLTPLSNIEGCRKPRFTAALAVSHCCQRARAHTHNHTQRSDKFMQKHSAPSLAHEKG